MSAPRNDTYRHEVTTELGAVVRICGEHDRIYLVIRVPGSRIPLTVPMPRAQAEELFTRGREIVAVQNADLARRDT